MAGKEKKSYKKPEVTRVQLEPKEAVLSGCKSFTVAAYSAANKKVCSENPCTSADGS